MNSFYLYWSYPKKLWYLDNFKKMIELEANRSKNKSIMICKKFIFNILESNCLK